MVGDDDRHKICRGLGPGTRRDYKGEPCHQRINCFIMDLPVFNGLCVEGFRRQTDGFGEHEFSDGG